jgi:hypothetical protein
MRERSVSQYAPRVGPNNVCCPCGCDSDGATRTRHQGRRTRFTAKLVLGGPPADLDSQQHACRTGTVPPRVRFARPLRPPGPDPNRSGPSTTPTSEGSYFRPTLVSTRARRAGPSTLTKFTHQIGQHKLVEFSWREHSTLLAIYGHPFHLL